MYNDAHDYLPNVAVMGKLSRDVVIPQFFGLGVQMNMLTVIFKTEQQVGSDTDKSSGVWVDSPLNYDFGLYCLVKDLPEIYYVPEPAEPTTLLPRSSNDAPIPCEGRIIPLTLPMIGTYNRAVLSLSGRLLKNTVYGFKIRIDNTPVWSMTGVNEWKIWTYEAGNTQQVDGTYTSPRFNAEVVEGQASMSFGAYQVDFPSYLDPVDNEYYSQGFVVTLGDLRPQVSATTITIFPITVGFTAMTHVRVLAPAGYVWDYVPQEFIYESITSGVQPDRAVPGAELDLPISLIPPKPIVEPYNELRLDYMKNAFRAGFKYGFVAKIRVPQIAPTNSLNRFTIEFGYDKMVIDDRYSVGIYPARMVRKLINADIAYTTSLVADSTTANIAAPARRMLLEQGSYAKGCALSGDGNGQCMEQNEVDISADGAVRRDLATFDVQSITSGNKLVNTLTFTIQTITDIPRGGGIVIRGPANFIFDKVCLPTAIEDKSDDMEV
jgi:hypothetical protein